MASGVEKTPLDYIDPLLDKAVLKIGAPYPSATFTVIAKNQSPEKKYIQSVTLNGKPLNTPQLRQREIVSGGTLEFVMGTEPNPKVFADLHPLQQF